MSSWTYGYDEDSDRFFICEDENPDPIIWTDEAPVGSKRYAALDGLLGEVCRLHSEPPHA